MSAFLNVDFWAFVGVVAGIYTIFALGLQLQFGFTGLLNFGHAAFMAVGAYTMAILIVQVGMTLWLAAPTAIAVAFAFGLLLGLPTVRLRGDFLAITMIAAAEIIRNLANNLQTVTGGPQGTINLLGAGRAASFNAEWLGFQRGVQNLLARVIGDQATKDVTMFVIIWVVALLLIAGMQLLVRSPWGRVLRAIREDEDAASALGKNVFAYKLQSLALGGALGAVAGLFFAFQFSFFSPHDFEPLTTFFAWVVMILGGTARNWGVPIGAIIFGVIFAGTRFFDFFPFSLFDSSELAFIRLIIIGLLLIGLMMFRPEGILGRRQEMVLE